MPDNKIEPIPESFSSLEAAGEFWDTHDTMDYPEDLVSEEGVTTKLRNRYFEVEIDMNVAQTLRRLAKERGVPVSELATELLRRQLTAA